MVGEALLDCSEHCVKQLVTALPHVTGSPSLARRKAKAGHRSIASRIGVVVVVVAACALTFTPPPSPSHSTNCSRKLNSRQSSMSLKCVFRMGAGGFRHRCSEVTLGRMKLWRGVNQPAKQNVSASPEGRTPRLPHAEVYGRLHRRERSARSNRESTLGAPLLEATEKMENRERRDPAPLPARSTPAHRICCVESGCRHDVRLPQPALLWPVPSVLRRVVSSGIY